MSGHSTGTKIISDYKCIVISPYNFIATHLSPKSVTKFGLPPNAALRQEYTGTLES